MSVARGLRQVQTDTNYSHVQIAIPIAIGTSN